MKDSKLSQLGGKSYQKCQVIMLPTDKNPAFFQIGNSDFFDLKKLDDRYEGRHLYILSDEEIKEGDWCYDKDNKVIYQAKEDNEYHDGKIIVTTDESLISKEYYCTHSKIEEDVNCPCHKLEGKLCKYKPIPRLSNYFIKAFVKAQGKGFDEVLVEYKVITCPEDDDCPCVMGCIQGYPKEKLKKDSWTREEVEDLLRKIYYDATGNMTGLGFVPDWIKENLK